MHSQPQSNDSREGDPSIHTTASSLSPIHDSEIARLVEGRPLLSSEDKTVVLKDIIVQCSPGEAAHVALGSLTLTILGLGEEQDTGHMEKVFPTTWKYSHVIPLQPDMDELMFIVQSDNAGDLGYLVLTKDELVAFRAIDHEIELERDFVVEENCPSDSLRITFTIGIYHNATPLSLNTIPGLQQMANTMQKPVLFSGTLAQFSENPELLNSFGDLFSQQFIETNREDDISKAISAYKLAVQLTSTDNMKYGVYVGDAGLALHRRFILSGKLPDINKAITMMEVACAYTSQDDVNMPSQLNNLGNSLLTRFKHTGDLADIESAISSQQRAVQLTPEGHADMPNWLSNLRSSFSTRFDCTGDLADIESAISSQQRAVQLTPEGHANLLCGPLLCMACTSPF